MQAYESLTLVKAARKTAIGVSTPHAVNMRAPWAMIFQFTELPPVLVVVTVASVAAMVSR